MEAEDRERERARQEAEEYARRRRKAEEAKEKERRRQAFNEQMDEAERNWDIMNGGTGRTMEEKAISGDINILDLLRHQERRNAMENSGWI